MVRKKRQIWLSIATFVLTISTQAALADDSITNDNYTEFFIPAVYPIENAWNEQSYDFTADVSAGSDSISAESLNTLEPASISDPLYYKAPEKFEKKDKNWEEELLDKLPYKNTLKYTWDFVDGDVDVMDVKNLRVDRGNRGLSYKTSFVPFAGDVDGTEIRAEVGEDTRLKFESDYVPMMGRMEGLKFKASLGDGASVSLRYKSEVNWQ